MPPKASPKTHTTRPQPDEAKPPNRDHRPRGATSSHRPIPTWIHTVADAAWIGWFDQMVDAAVHEVLHPAGRELAERLDTRRREPEGHGGLDLQQSVEDPESAEADTEDPPGHRLGRGVGPCDGNEALPWACSLRYWTVRTTLKPTAHSATSTKMAMS